jgi:hypothetical protein
VHALGTFIEIMAVIYGIYGEQIQEIAQYLKLFNRGFP